MIVDRRGVDSVFLARYKEEGEKTLRIQTMKTKPLKHKRVKDQVGIIMRAIKNFPVEIKEEEQEEDSELEDADSGVQVRSVQNQRPETDYIPVTPQHLLPLIDPEPNKTDNSLMSEEEMYRLWEAEIEEDIEHKRKERVEHLKIAACLPVCQCEGEKCPHKATNRVRQVWKKVNETKAEGIPLAIKTQSFVRPDTYADGFMAPLRQKGTCPYVDM